MKARDVWNPGKTRERTDAANQATTAVRTPRSTTTAAMQSEVSE
jgi:hypothetical protein